MNTAQKTLTALALLAATAATPASAQTARPASPAASRTAVAKSAEKSVAPAPSPRQPSAALSPALAWPAARPEARPGARWWWLGSAVDTTNLRWALDDYARHGIGTLEITPIYGVQGHQPAAGQPWTPGQNIPYLSDRWMQMLRYTQRCASDDSITLGMATGTGWPFGGPWVPLEESAARAVFADTCFTGTAVSGLPLTAAPDDRCRLDRVMAYWRGRAYDITRHVSDGLLTWNPGDELRADIAAARDKTLRRTLQLRLREMQSAQWKVTALYIRHGVMNVKRAAPGGEGLVVDHFDRKAVAHYLDHIAQAFDRTKTPYPHTFFNDSYEVADATWTPTLLDEFERRRGYRLQDYLPLLTAGDPRIVSDYRETLGDLLLENFTQQWTDWAHRHGAITRNQAHGSPANLIDCYAAVDIPEIEGFGLTDFGIRGLRTDPGRTRKNDSDLSMLKYAPSAAHVCGKPLTSSETFTWLTEHFRTSLSQLKPDIDLMFCAGVNHMFFHGTCYSPKDEPWPGWKFYASIDMSPTNSIWRDAPYFMQYVERCQRFLQWGQPDNDFLVYLPVRDMWQQQTDRLLMQFSIHQMGRLAPDFIQTILSIDRAGFDCDYISDRLLLGVSVSNGRLVTQAGTRYRGLVIPDCREMPARVVEHIDSLRAQGAHIIYSTRARELATAARPEALKTVGGLKAIRRSNPTGHHYFIANLTPDDVCAALPLAVTFAGAAWFDPMTGAITPAVVSGDSILVDLRSGESRILQTFADSIPQALADISGLSGSARPADISRSAGLSGSAGLARPAGAITLTGPWTLSFTEEAPRVDRTFTLDAPHTWETLGDDSASVTMGTGVYTTTVRLTRQQLRDTRRWQIDLGDVRESARVYINGRFIGCAWAVPFILDCGTALKAGQNTIRIEVTNLPANRIADYDRRGIPWRKMEEINVVDINYQRTTYDRWEPVPSGLNSKVKLVYSL